MSNPNSVDTDLIKVTGDIARIKFEKDKEPRKLKPTFRNIKRAIAAAQADFGRKPNLGELTTDWFNGHPYLVWGLMAPALGLNETLTVDDACDLIDKYMKQGGKQQELQNALVMILAEYMHVEVTTRDEDGSDPNSKTPDQPGPQPD